MGLETTRMVDDLQTMEERLVQERSSSRSLESAVSALRQERTQQEEQLRTFSRDLCRLQQRETAL